MISLPIPLSPSTQRPYNMISLTHIILQFLSSHSQLLTLPPSLTLIFGWLWVGLTHLGLKVSTDLPCWLLVQIPYFKLSPMSSSGRRHIRSECHYFLGQWDPYAVILEVCGHWPKLRRNSTHKQIFTNLAWFWITNRTIARWPYKWTPGKQIDAELNKSSSCHLESER